MRCRACNAILQSYMLEDDLCFDCLEEANTSLKDFDEPKDTYPSNEDSSNYFDRGDTYDSERH